MFVLAKNWWQPAVLGIAAVGAFATTYAIGLFAIAYGITPIVAASRLRALRGRFAG